MDLTAFTPSADLAKYTSQPTLRHACRQFHPDSPCSYCSKPLGAINLALDLATHQAMSSILPRHRNCLPSTSNPETVDYTLLPMVLPLHRRDSSVVNLPVILVNPSRAAVPVFASEDGTYQTRGLSYLQALAQEWGTWTPLADLVMDSPAAGAVARQGETWQLRAAPAGEWMCTAVPPEFASGAAELGSVWVALSECLHCLDLASSSDPFGMIAAADAENDFQVARLTLP